jgi:hypothetical protein
LRVLSSAELIILNSKELIRQIDDVGAEINRVGNNINQLARHANRLKLLGILDPEVATKFNVLFERYLRDQAVLAALFRKFIRMAGK